MKQPTKKVLITPQHWGLGHVTRTIPIIRYFVEQGWKVLLASSGPGAELLRKEFKDLQVFELPDYKILYPSRNMYWNMAIQMYKMHSAIIREHFAIRKICKLHEIDLLISDARLGAAQNFVPSIIITHHLHFPLSYRLFEWCADTWMRFFYMRFDQIWIPDFEESNNLGGALDHQFKSNKHYYFGPLSRFKKIESDKKYDYCFLLSGPEPQRTRLEKIFLSQLKNLNFKKAVLVRGSQNSEVIPIIKNLEIVDFATSHQLNEIMCSSDLIISRSGYSTLLDLSIINKKALLIPTPGQPEQEYLGRELARKKIFHCVDQDELDLIRDIPLAQELTGYKQLPDRIELCEIIPKLLSSLI
ncbi:MAG: glycosyltransferase [Saprospiraceae bacterium]|nr:glycosyltransferase [Saprospiraceae bacterium]